MKNGMKIISLSLSLSLSELLCLVPGLFEGLGLSRRDGMGLESTPWSGRSIGEKRKTGDAAKSHLDGGIFEQPVWCH